jgi:Holliday junction resolvase
MKKYNIILISRHANFTKAVVNREDYLLTEIKYQEHNVARLSFESVRQILDFRFQKEAGWVLTKKFALFLAFFIDNTDVLIQSMKLLGLEKKNKKDYYLFIDYEYPPEKELYDLHS